MEGARHEPDFVSAFVPSAVNLILAAPVTHNNLAHKPNQNTPTNASGDAPEPASGGPHRWKKGETVNPGGRIGTGDVRAIARQRTPAAFKALDQMLKRPGERAEAVKIILDRAYGKPATTVNVRVIKSMQDLSEEELLALSDGTQVIEGAVLPDTDDDC